MAETSSDGSIDVSQFMQAGTDIGKQLQSALKDFTTLQSKQAAATAEEQKGIRDAAAADADVKTLDALKEEKIRKANAEAAAWFGVNPAANSFVLAGLGNEIVSGVKDLGDRRKDIQGRLDQNFFDSPVQWLVNQVVLPFKQEAYAAAEEGVGSNITIAQGLIARAKDEAGILSAIEEGDATQRIAAIQKGILAKASVDVAQSDQRLAALGLQGINVRLAIDDKTFSAVVAATDMQFKLRQLEFGISSENREERRLTLAGNADIRDQDRLDLQKREQKLREELQRIQISASGEDAASRTEMNARLAKAATVVGAEPPTWDQYKRFSPRQREQWDNLMSNPDVMQSGRLGFNPGLAIEAVTENNWPLVAGMQPVFHALDNIRSEVAQEYSKAGNATPWASLTKDVRANIINSKIREQLIREQGNIKDTGSIYSPPPVAAVMAIPAAAATSIMKDLAPQVDGAQPFRAQVVMSSALRKVTAGELSPEQAAAEVSTIYKAIIADNNVQRQYAKFAVTGLSESGTGFKTNITTNNFSVGQDIFGGSQSKIVDMSNQSELTTILLRAAIAAKTNNPAIFNSTAAKPGGATPPKSAAQGAATSSDSGAGAGRFDGLIEALKNIDTTSKPLGNLSPPAR